VFIKNTEILVDVACVAYRSVDAATTTPNSKNGEMNMKVYKFTEDSLI
jgi:hypothetical protein